MRNKGQLVTIGGLCSIICVNAACAIWTWPDYHVFGWFGLFWFALTCFICVHLIVNNNRKWAFVALAVAIVAFFINCQYLATITAQV